MTTKCSFSELPEGTAICNAGLSTNPRSQTQSWLSEPFTEGPRISKKTPPPLVSSQGGLKKLYFIAKKR